MRSKYCQCMMIDPGENPELETARTRRTEARKEAQTRRVAMKSAREKYNKERKQREREEMMADPDSEAARQYRRPGYEDQQRGRLRGRRWQPEAQGRRRRRWP